MNDADFGKVLRKMRNDSGKTVPEVSEHLMALGYKAAIQTVYGWERGLSQPNPDPFLAMCKFYGVTDILSYFGDDPIETKNPPSAAEAAPEGRAISMEESNRLLEALGLIEEGQELTDDDLAFLTHIIGLLDAWFGKGK